MLSNLDLLRIDELDFDVDLPPDEDEDEKRSWLLDERISCEDHYRHWVMETMIRRIDDNHSMQIGSLATFSLCEDMTRRFALAQENQTTDKIWENILGLVSRVFEQDIPPGEKISLPKGGGGKLTPLTIYNTLKLLWSNDSPSNIIEEIHQRLFQNAAFDTSEDVTQFLIEKQWKQEECEMFLAYRNKQWDVRLHRIAKRKVLDKSDRQLLFLRDFAKNAPVDVWNRIMWFCGPIYEEFKCPID